MATRRYSYGHQPRFRFHVYSCQARSSLALTLASRRARRAALARSRRLMVHPSCPASEGYTKGRPEYPSWLAAAFGQQSDRAANHGPPLSSASNIEGFFPSLATWLVHENRSSFHTSSLVFQGVANSGPRQPGILLVTQPATPRAATLSLTARVPQPLQRPLFASSPTEPPPPVTPPLSRRRSCDPSIRD